jgi:hypothetical protein
MGTRTIGIGILHTTTRIGTSTNVLPRFHSQQSHAESIAYGHLGKRHAAMGPGGHDADVIGSSAVYVYILITARTCFPTVFTHTGTAAILVRLYLVVSYRSVLTGR